MEVANKEATADGSSESSSFVVIDYPVFTYNFPEAALQSINAFRKEPKTFYKILEQFKHNISDGPSYDKIQYKHWKYKIEHGNFEYLKNYINNLEPMKELQRNDLIAIPATQANKDDFYNLQSELQSTYNFEASFYTRINEPNFAIVVRCLSNIIKGVFDCGKYDIFNDKFTSIGIDCNNGGTKNFFATFTFK